MDETTWAVETFYSPSARSTAPGLPTVFEALAILEPDHAQRLTSAAADLRLGRWPARRPRLAEGPLAAFLFSSQRPWRGLPFVDDARLRALGPTALAALQELEKEAGSAAAWVFPLLVVLATSELDFSDADGIGHLLAGRYKEAGTFNAYAHRWEQIVEAVAGARPVITRRAITRPTSLHAPAGHEAGVAGPSAKAPGRVQDERRRTRLFAARSGRSGTASSNNATRDKRPTQKGPSQERDALQHLAGLRAPSLPSAQHIAHLMSECDVRWDGERIVGTTENVATLGRLFLSVLHLGEAEHQVVAGAGPPPRETVGAVFQEDWGCLLLPLEAKISGTLYLDPSVWWVAPDDPATAPTDSIVTWGVHHLTPMEVGFWKAQIALGPNPDSRLSAITGEQFAGRVVKTASLRVFGRALALECGLEPADICLAGGPAAGGDDSQVAYESRPVATLGARLCRTRQLAAKWLLEALPETERDRLLNQGHVLAHLALSGESPPPAPWGAGSRAGTRFAVLPWVAHTLVNRASEALSATMQGTPERDALVAALTVDLLVNYGRRLEVLPKLRQSYVRRRDGILYDPGKRGQGGLVDGTMPWAPETLQLLRRLDAVRGPCSDQAFLLPYPRGRKAKLDKWLLDYLGLSQELSGFWLRSCRQAFVERLVQAGVSERRRRALLHHDDPLRTPYQPWTAIRASVLCLPDALAAVRIPLGLPTLGCQ
ncbi:MAG: hypothetical protein ACYCZN_15245 [Candidatus Dormibacteria bacterium]